ncbi:MAG: hypothetical protein LC754_08695 [Acidobacteria bacterium]|nr:hypothetical protein [Acidobacteriota bacterium]
MLRLHLKWHGLFLVAFNLALYLPMVGRGFVHDDFEHLYSVSFQPFSEGLTRAQAGPFYTPLVWLTFRVDWGVWGLRSFPMAVEDLLAHIFIVLLLYHLAFLIWNSRVAALWAALGFSLLFPANTWAMMYIGTRAHVLATLFFIAALISAFKYANAARYKIALGVIVVVNAAFAMLAKESGITVVAAVPILLIYVRLVRAEKLIALGDVLILLALLALALVYLWLRSRAGAVPVVSGDELYSYQWSMQALVGNLLRYIWRTYGLLMIIAGAIFWSECLYGRRPHLRLLAMRDVLLSIMLFAVTIAPFILLYNRRSAVYSYLPGVGAALFLGGLARALYGTPSGERPPPKLLKSMPVILVVIVYSALTISSNLKWMRIAIEGDAVLRQIAAQQPVVKPGAFISLNCPQLNSGPRCLEAFGNGFALAVRVLYRDKSLDGAIIRQGEPYSLDKKVSEVQFEYRLIDGKPMVIKTTENLPPH